MLAKQYRIQYLATFIVDLGLFLLGIVIGWISPNTTLLASANSPLESGKLTDTEIQWVASISILGSIVGVVIFGLIIDKLGRKWSIILIGAIFAISWIILYLAKNVTFILISRVLAGVSTSGVFIAIPAYVSEIADSQIRGRLGSAFSVICNIGIMMEFVMAKYLDFYTVPLIALGISVIFIIGILVMPETPQQLISKNKFDDAEKSFKFYRNYKSGESMSTEHSNELENLKNINPADKSNENENANIFKQLIEPGSLKRALMALVVCNFPLLSGCFVLITFTHEIFKVAGSDLNVDESSIIFAAIQLIGSMITVPLIDRAGRKILLSSTALGSAICFCVFGVYLSLKSNGVDVSSFSFIPLYSLCLNILISSIGIIPVPNIYIPEILDQKMRGIVMSVCNFETWILGFLMIHFYFSMAGLIGVHGVMYFFSCTCLFSCLVTIFFLPETKGRDIEEIARSIGK